VLLHLILAALALLSLAITLWQWLAARRFPLHQRAADTSFAPGVTLLKPLKGLDPETRGCLESWFKQDYRGPVQRLFGVADEKDPVCEVVRQLIAEHPQANAQLVLCPEQLGPNAKVSTLVHLERLAQHDHFVVSDADTRVPPDFLAQLVQPLRDPQTGIVNCFYALTNPTTLAMQWEAVAVNADFWSQVLQSRTLAPMDFALGAAMLVRRSALAQIGGFRSLADHLADDFQLGHRLAKAGWKVELSPVVVECLDAPAGWGAIWAHQVRWNRTIRVCRPGPYIASILANGTLWNTLAAAVVWLHPSLPPQSRGPWIGLFMGMVIARSTMAHALAWRLSALPGRDRRGDPFVFGMAAGKDLLGAAVWAASIVGDTVHWRGVDYTVDREGKLTPLPSPQS